MNCTFFLFCFVRFKCFCLSWIKTKLYSANKAKPFFLQIILQDSYVNFKKASCAVCGENWVRVSCYFCQVCISYFTLQICVNLIPEWHSSSIEKKSGRSLYIFLKPRGMKVVCINLVINYMFFWFGVMLGTLCQTQVELELKIIIDSLPQSCILKNN